MLNNNLYEINNSNEQNISELSMNLHLLNKMVKLIPKPCFVIDREGAIVIANEHAQNSFNIRESFKIDIECTHKCITQMDYELFKNWHNDFFNNLNPSSTIRITIYHNEVPKHIELSGQTILVEKDIYLLVVITDYSTILEETTSLISHNSEILKKALDFERNKSEFYINISHELRTPLNVILGTVQLTELSIKNLDKTVNGHSVFDRRINVIKQNCYRLLKLVNNLIDISRLDAGYNSVELCNCDIVAQVSDIVNSISEYAENRSLTLKFSSTIDELIIACDSDKIERILFNLLSNAMKFSKEGGIIEVSMECDKKWVTITVKDNGIGIPQNKLKSIFKRFKQVNDDLTSRSGGSGLGLSLVKSLVDLLKGNVTVDSKPGFGSEFVVRLPNKKHEVKGINEDIVEHDCSTLKPDMERIRIEFSDL